MSYKKKIEELVQERLAKYKKIDAKADDAEIKATYNREKETTSGYNGRQLLELIQNADDAKSDEILIKLNTKEQTLIIANKGKFCTSFDVDGVKSLLLANLSPKTSNDYIGNKGLGFRSIINWSDKITINSNDLDIAFSQSIAEQEFKKIGSDETKLPILAIPKLTENPQNQWKTCITIKYKDDYLKDIKEQISQLKAEILLFLNHLKTINIDRDYEQKSIEKPDKLWTIKPKPKAKANSFPKELLNTDDKNSKYELKIAFNNELDNKGNEYLFSYFPTNIKISMPFIVHGTFNLDSTRNQLNKTDNKNRFVLEKLVDLIITTAKELSEGRVSYKALEFLNYSHKNEVLDDLGFYDRIDSAIEELDVYPCLDGEYRIKKDVIYCNNLSKFIENNTDYRLIPNLLIATDDENITDILSKQREFQRCSYFNTKKEDIESLNKIIKEINDRIEFIHLLIENGFNGKLPLLIDEEENLIIEGEVYTPPTQEFTLPDYVKIKFMNKSFFDKLISKFQINSNEKARELQRELKDITNIHSYEPAPVLQKIISKTNEEVKNNPDKKIEIIQKMVKSLYENYQKLGNLNIPTDTKIQLLNKQGELSDAKGLYLSKTYPSGELTEFLFADVFGDEDFLADIDIFGLEGDKQKIEDFFLWLGVNKYTKFIRSKSEYMLTDNGYQHVNANFTSIEKFDKIKGLPIADIVTWLILDKENIENALSNVQGNYQYHVVRYEDVRNNAALQLEALFKDHLISDSNKINDLVNNKCIDYKHSWFKENNVHKADIDSLLLKLGAVEKFDGLSSNKVNEVLQFLQEKDPNGKLAQKIYIESFKNHEEYDACEEINLLAKKGVETDYFPQNEVYYAGSVKLPKEYTQQLAIFDYPKRADTKDIIKFFGIEDLSSVQPIIKNKKLSDIDNEFQIYFQKIKPYILAYRIENIDKHKKEEAKKLNDITIALYQDITCEIDNEKYELSDYDYLIDDGDYLIKVPKHKLDTIRQKYDFYTIFGGVISLVFDVKDAAKFENCIKDKIENTIQDINDNIGSNAINDAKKLLGISSDFYDFWHTIYTLLDKQYSDSHNDNLDIINQELKTDIKKYDIDYEDLSKNSETLIRLFKKLNIAPVRFNEESGNKIDFSNYHQKKIENCFNDNHNNFKQCLHKYCVNNNKRGEFLAKLDQYKKTVSSVADLEIDYQKECENFVKNEFNFELKIIKNIADIDTIYEQNQRQLGDDFEHIENNDNIRSLLYFENLMSKVERHIENEKEAEKQQEENNQLEHKNTKEIKSAKLTTPLPRQENINSGHQSSSHQQQDKQKKHAGHKAEEEVRTSLVKKYGEKNVTWVSRDKKGANHDFEYKDKNNKWWYVEVKTLSNNKFYISKNEKKFAEKHKDNYQIFLVGDQIKQIYPVDFDSLKIEATDFVVYYQLTE